jgi:parallel beta-helix repeat protein
MPRRKWAILLASILLFASCAVFAGYLVFPTLPRSVVVPDDFPTIQAAIDNCGPGSTIHVRNGIYNELLVVDKPLTLIGENRQNTIIKGNYTLDKSNASINYTVYTTANITANNVVISNLNIYGSDNGVSISGNNCQLIDNNIQAFDAVITNVGSNQTFTGNNIVGNQSQWGMLCWGTNILVSGNTFENVNCGILIQASNMIIEKNTFANCKYKDVNDFSSGISFLLGENNKVYENFFQNLTCGIIYQGANYTSVYNNTFNQNNAGVKLQGHIFFRGPSGVNNFFFSNNLIDNQVQVVFVKLMHGIQASANTTDIICWDNGIVGNYWSDYSIKYPDATQNSTTATYNTPYTIDAKNKDNHPLANK